MKRMRIYYISLVIGVMMVLAGAAPLRAGAGGEATSFFTSIQDMPLMPGLVELPDQTVIFDKPEGRIIESVASLESVSPEAIKAYYESTLPQLGWQRIADGSFVRKDERLQLNFESYGGENYLRLMVAPKDGF